MSYASIFMPEFECSPPVCVGFVQAIFNSQMSPSDTIIEAGRTLITQKWLMVLAFEVLLTCRAASIPSMLASFCWLFLVTIFLALAQKDHSFMANPAYRALIGFPTGEVAFIELKGRPV